MRVMSVEIGWDFALRALAGHPMSEVRSDIPDDARVVSVDLEPSRRIAHVYVESATFDEVPDGYVIPQFSPVVTMTITEQMRLADLVSKRHDVVAEENERLRNRLLAAGVDPDA